MSGCRASLALSPSPVCALVMPLPILFHVWFLDGVVWPLVGMEKSQ